MSLMESKPLIGKRLLRFEESLWDDSRRYALSLGCPGCVDFRICRGLHLKGGGVGCGEFCCGRPEECGDVCRANPGFARRHAEVEGFRLDNVPRACALPPVDLPAVVPVIFHAKKRSAAFDAKAVAIKLYSLFDRRTGEARFKSRRALCEAFRISDIATIVVTGIEEDRQVERWWELSEKRLHIIANLRELGIALVAVPNFTLHLNRPRQSDLYAMKRIALVHEEFLRGGMPAALHVNGRTDYDFERWTGYVREREEISYISYEFTTGGGRAERRAQHTAWLCALARDAGRPLHLIVAGGRNVWPELAAAFASVIVLETSIFMKAVYRMGAVPVGNAGLDWKPAPTPPGQPLDDLLRQNHSVVSSAFGLLTARPAITV